jgi:endonuclease/exonuclease/phosphatase family metal-dependent hydrolase
MKGLSIFNKIVLSLNILAMATLLASCITPFVTIDQLPILPYLSLVVPIIVIVNLLFVLYWSLVRKRFTLVSLTALLIAFMFHGTFYELRFRDWPVLDEDLSVMSFNTRGFDPYGQLHSDHVAEDIIDFVKTQDPDIVCFQEFDHSRIPNFMQYPYHVFHYRSGIRTFVPQAIFSKYPIVGEGSLNFPDSGNNTIYADIVYQKDTVRIYNVHLQSYKFVPKRGHVKELATVQFYRRLNNAFHLQQQQAEMVAGHMAATPYPKILCGDLNNTQFSKVYRVLRNHMTDSFRAKGAGYGRTFNFKYYPLRIDFIFGSLDFEVRAHKNFTPVLSDHFPVMASFRLKKE